ncbi:hypothetical protein DFP72DRAFT_1077346 [Ephemerocybe angulata]|uniref:Uncharacterized protein n=1 Tax=Ephemerocybe angulata TaxID=980116 RepID=A0A8H6HEH4_9AGAR|nr:hypothetical protein DFP72DRAFT_1077346 [Tulosesus angulatus]
MPQARNASQTVSLARSAFSYKPVLLHLKSLYYDAHAFKETMVDVPTLAHPTGSQRFPCAETVLGVGATHDVVVSVIDGRGKENRFLVVCQIGAHLPVNRPLLKLAPDVAWAGSVLIMKMGQRLPFVGMSSMDKADAILAVFKFINACDGPELPTFIQA